ADGQSHQQVRATLGAPIEESWLYPPPGENPANLRADEPGVCGALRFEHDRVSETFAPDACASRGVRVGQSNQDVERILGVPSDTCWEYSKAPPRRPFRLRLGCFHASAVQLSARPRVF